MRLSFLSTILKGWHRLWARRSRKERQLTGIQLMVQSLVMTWSFILMPSISCTPKHAWARTTLFQLQWRTCSKSWPGLGTNNPSHLMRWRYFILTHPAKCKMTRTEFSWKLSDAVNITQTSNQFLFSFSFFLFSFFINRTEVISWIRKRKVVKRNLQRKAKSQPSDIENLIVWICCENGFQKRLFRLQSPDLVMHDTRYFSCSGNYRRSTLKKEHPLLITTS